MKRLGHNPTVIMLYVVDYHNRYGRGPQYLDIMAETHLSKSTVHHYLKRLRTAGLVEWEPGRHGTLRPLVQAVTL